MDWETIMKGAKQVIVVAVNKDEEMHLAYGDNMDEMDVLDLLSMATTYFYLTASDRGDETLQ